MLLPRSRNTYPSDEGKEAHGIPNKTSTEAHDSVVVVVVATAVVAAAAAADVIVIVDVLVVAVLLMQFLSLSFTAATGDDDELTNSRSV